MSGQYSVRKTQKRLGTRKLLFKMDGFMREHHIEIGRDAMFDLLATFMTRIYLIMVFLTLAVLAAGCRQNQKHSNVIDFETLIKDDHFRSQVPTGSFVKLSEGYTYYEYYPGIQPDTLVVMVHGFSVPSYIWDSTFQAVAAHGYGALRYDVYGRGFSDNPDVVYDAALYSNQLCELLDKLHLHQKLNLMGLSYGGRIISAFAFQYPDRIENLIYVDPAGFETIASQADYPQMASSEEVKAFKESPAYATMAASQLGDFYDPVPFAGWDKRYKEMMKFQGFVRALISTRKNSPSMEMEHLKIGLSNLSVFCFWGRHDTVVVLDQVRQNLYQRIPQIQLIEMEDSGHLPHMEQAALFNNVLINRIIRKREQQ